jgi:uncharacterized damage-inducible protein DinB
MGREGCDLMLERDRLGGFIQHMEWADALMWQSIDPVPGAQHDRRLIALVHHLHLVQWIYLAIWHRETPAITDPQAYENARAVRNWAQPYYSKAAAWIDSLDDSSLGRVVEFPWADEIAQKLGSAGPATLRETIAQILLHSTYHRGQVATRIRELGGEPALTDYITWIWMNRPRARWPGRAEACR